MVSVSDRAFSCDDVWLFKETMETMAITEPLATKGPKERKETKVIDPSFITKILTTHMILLLGKLKWSK